MTNRKDNIKKLIYDMHDIDSEALNIRKSKHGITVSFSYGISKRFAEKLNITYFHGCSISWDSDKEYHNSIKRLLEMKRFLIESNKE